MKWQHFRHFYQEKRIFHEAERIDLWLEELLNRLHADRFINITPPGSADQMMEVMILYPLERDEGYNEKGELING
jgi:hypothetical protein